MTVFVAVSAGCGRAGTVKKEQDNVLKLGVIPVEDNFPFFVAEKEGLFARAGINVELIVFNSARDRDIALQSRSIDGEVADIIAAVLMYKSGTPVKIVSLTAGATPAEGRFVLLSSPGSGIDNPGQLAGASIGISKNTIIEYVTDGLLAEAGIKPEEVNKIAVPQIPERLQLLLSDKLDAALLPDPLASLAEKEGAHVILDDTKTDRNLSQVVLVFREETIKNKADLITKLLGVYNEAAVLASENPETYRELFITKARVPEVLRDTYLSPKFAPPQLPGKKEVNDVIMWMLHKKLITEPLNYEDIVEPAFIESISITGGNL